ncbi:MAG: hypothetical protein SOX26_05555 [Phocaeicola sp.]|nr:hypothetical protein [Phocaeicola sp.]
MAIPKSVQNLKLCYAFKGYKQKVEDCITVTSANEFYIEDNPESKCTVIVDSANFDKKCRVINLSSSEAVLLAIDNKLISNREIADGAVFNMDDFHFIEFKTNAEGNSDKAVSDTYDKAISQLQSTINLFEVNLSAVGIDFKNKINIGCHIVVSEAFPRNNAVEITKAMDFAYRTLLPLSFDNEIELSYSME